MRIQDLPAPVVATKSDWLAGSTWMGFTPRQDNLASRNACIGAVQRQFRGGYVLEYITANFGSPNPGFESDGRYLEERARHSAMAGRLVAIHRLRQTSRSLRAIVGDIEFEYLQDMWSQSTDRTRWSVAFPIIDSYEILGWPRASDVFDQASYRRLYAHPVGLLQPLNDLERAQLGGLEVERREARNAWIALEDEMAAVDASPTDSRIAGLLERDFALGAMEGETEERRQQLRKRAAWLAKRFVLRRQREDRLNCDACGFDPRSRIGSYDVKPRSLLDVHHTCPIAEGKRYTSEDDFALLCPTCHRLEHSLLRRGQSLLGGV